MCGQVLRDWYDETKVIYCFQDHIDLDGIRFEQCVQRIVNLLPNCRITISSDYETAISPEAPATQAARIRELVGVDSDEVTVQELMAILPYVRFGPDSLIELKCEKANIRVINVDGYAIEIEANPIQIEEKIHTSLDCQTFDTLEALQKSFKPIR